MHVPYKEKKIISLYTTLNDEINPSCVQLLLLFGIFKNKDRERKVKQIVKLSHKLKYISL